MMIFNVGTSQQTQIVRTSETKIELFCLYHENIWNVSVHADM